MGQAAARRRDNLQIAAPKETVGTAVDSAARTVTRLRTLTNRLDTLTNDKPRDGLRYRAPNICTIDGVSINCAELVQLPLQGMGIVLSLTAVVNPSTAAFYEFSIIKP